MGDVGNKKGRRIGGKNRPCAGAFFEIAKESLLDLQVLDNRLHDQIRLRKTIPRRRAADRFEFLQRRLAREYAILHGLVKQFGDALHTCR